MIDMEFIASKLLLAIITPITLSLAQTPNIIRRMISSRAQFAAAASVMARLHDVRVRSLILKFCLRYLAGMTLAISLFVFGYLLAVRLHPSFVALGMKTGVTLAVCLLVKSVFLRMGAPILALAFTALRYMLLPIDLGVTLVALLAMRSQSKFGGFKIRALVKIFQGRRVFDATLRADFGRNWGRIVGSHLATPFADWLERQGSLITSLPFVIIPRKTV